MNEAQELLDQMITPEGRAFSDYIEGIDCNPYPFETADHARYDAAMKDMLEGASE